MSWGIETQGFFGRLPIDDDYDNLVFHSQGSREVSTGYQTIPMVSRGVPSLIVAARHPGLDVALLGYTSDEHGTTGVRVYVRGNGRFYWRLFQASYPLPTSGWGMVVYNASGKQTFHSDHRYADVKNSQDYLGATGRPLAGRYYLFNTPATPTFEYQTYFDSWYDERYSYQQTGTRQVSRQVRVYRCWTEWGFVNGRYQSYQVCGYVWETEWYDEPVYGWVVTGYWVYVISRLYCTKHVPMVRHSTSDHISEYRHRTHNWALCYDNSFSYFDPTSRVYNAVDQLWVYRSFQPVYTGHLQWLASPSYYGISGHANKLIMME